MKGFLHGMNRSPFNALLPTSSPYRGVPQNEEDRSTSAYVLGVTFVVFSLTLIFLLLSPRTSTSNDLTLSFFAALLGGIGIASILGGVTLSSNARDRKQNIAPYTDELIEELHGTRYCERCGNIIIPPKSHFCSNCGAGVPGAPSDISSPIDQERVGFSVTRVGQAKRTPLCMICNLSIEPSELRAWCPYCGRVAHREHLLAWVRERKRCPVCGRHMEEEQLRKQLFQVKRRSRTRSIDEEHSGRR